MRDFETAFVHGLLLSERVTEVEIGQSEADANLKVHEDLRGSEGEDE